MPAVGFELGNHTYSHQSLNRLPLEEIQADVLRGEPATHKLLADRGKTLRYFRHPFLQVGLELPRRRAFEAYLKERGYTAAPVTIDNDEYVFAAVYAKRGYRFVTLEEALRDPAYALPDDYVGAWGISWLHHWEVTAGLKRSPSPDPAEWITTAYEALSR